MTPLERQKSIAVAFVSAISFKHKPRIEEQYDAWLLTEEGKRLTAEEPENEEEVKWLRAAMETQYEAYEALAKETAAGIKALNEKLDRIEGSMKFEPKE